MAQYGWHVQILKQTDSTAKLRIWNASVDIDGKVMQTPDSKPVTLGTDVDVNVKATNIGGMMNGFFFVPISPNAAYVPDSVYGGAYPVTAGAAQALAAKHGIANLVAPAGVAVARSWAWPTMRPRSPPAAR